MTSDKVFTLPISILSISILIACGPVTETETSEKGSTGLNNNYAAYSSILSNSTNSNELASTATKLSNPALENKPAIQNPSKPAIANGFDNCPGPNGNSTPTVISQLSIQSHGNFSNASGQLKAYANGVRRGLESNRNEAVNCISWIDSNYQARTVNLGSYMYGFTIKGENSNTRYEATDDAVGHPGFGILVSHNTQNGNSPLGSFMPPNSAKTTVFAGANHSIHQIQMNYNRDYEGGGYGIQIPATIEWLVVAGQNNPIWSVNWQMDKVINPNHINFDNYRMDTRGPYGSIGWDGKKASEGNSELVKMVEWGAGGKKFVATQNNGIRSGSAWTYNQDVPLNYNKSRPVSSPLEFGLVQTQTDLFMGYQDGVGGLLDKTSQEGVACPSENTVMPCSWAWPYQMMQFSGQSGEFSSNPTNGKLMAWGSPYGYLGASSFYNFLYNGTQSGKNQRKYATSIVWGEYSNSANDPVEKTMNQTNAISNYLKITNLKDKFNNPKGKYRCLALIAACNPDYSKSPSTLAYSYNPAYMSQDFQLKNSNIEFTISNSAPNLSNLVAKNPLLIFNNYDGRPASIKLNNNVIASGSDYLASYDTAQKRLFVTLLKTISPGQQYLFSLN